MKRLKPLIGICGPAGSGKDTLADGIAAMDIYFKYAFADPIKAAINIMFGFGPAHWENRGWKEEVLPWIGVSPRTLAQSLGTEWGRDMVDQELWLKIAQQKFAKIDGTARMEHGRILGLGMIIPDVRFDNEAQWIKDAGGLLLKIDRPSMEISESSHATEAGVDPALIDAVIVNDGPPSVMVMAARKVLWESSGVSAAAGSGTH